MRLGLNIYVEPPTIHLTDSTRGEVGGLSPNPRDMTWPIFFFDKIFQNLWQAYREDFQRACWSGSQLDFDATNLGNGFGLALQMQRDLTDRQGTLTGFDLTTHTGLCFALAMLKHKPLRLQRDASLQKREVSQFSEDRLNAVFAIEIGWVIKRYLMLIDDPDDTRGSNSFLNQKIPPPKAIVDAALQEFRERHVQANHLLTAVLEGTFSYRECMLHYECILGRIMRTHSE